MKELRVTGIMSGTSLDGVDLALCIFREGETFSYEISRAVTIEYTDEWRYRLRALETATAAELAFEHAAFGEYLGSLAKDFNGTERVDFISSHGHTIFHQPSRKFTFQLGSGAAIAAIAGVPVVCDFRSKDIALNGQGAPLVPIGDELLFGKYTACLNLGGIANISYNSNSERIAFDICPVNLLLNELAVEQGLKYDDGGSIASNGKLISSLLEELNGIDFYSLKTPRSLGREILVDRFLPVLARYSSVSLSDRLHTVCVHIAQQISYCAPADIGDTTIVTGGGAYNTHLLSLIRKECKSEVVVPEKKIIEFKEALIFAFLGVLRWEGKINSLRSVTGASEDSCGGCIYK